MDKQISNKVGAYADDVNIMMPRSEASIREVISTLDKFEAIAVLRVNKDKTQMLKIGKGAPSSPSPRPRLRPSSRPLLLLLRPTTR